MAGSSVVGRRAALATAIALAAGGCDVTGGQAQAERSAVSASAAGASTTSAPFPAAASAAASAGAAPACPACLSIERCDPTTGRCVPGCPAGEVFLPATPAEGFTMGQDLSGKKDDLPHAVVLTRPFCMDATEVTARAYGECVAAERCEKPRWWGLWTTYDKQPDHPVNKVHWSQAKAYCEFRGQSLPTEAQWEWAATGGDGRKWPWGNEEPNCERADFTEGVLPSPGGDAGCHGGGPSAVGTHPTGAKHWPNGDLQDLAGNVWEWCLDNYLPYPKTSETDPLHLVSAESVHVVRGGGWNRSWRGILAAYRGGARRDYQVPGLGFRCVRNPASG